MLRRYILPVASTGLLAIVAANGCGTHMDFDCVNRNMPCTPDDGGGVFDGSLDAGNADGGADGANDGPPACDVTKSPSDDPCVIDDRIGVFVDRAASDAGAALGTKAAPFGTISTAVAAAKTAGKRVYVCDGTYSESIALDSSNNGLRLYGGFTCGSWSYGTSKAKVRPTVKGYALSVQGITGLVVEDFDFGAQDASPNDSSIAAFVRDSSGVKLASVKLTAGAGGPGAPGSLAQAGVSAPVDRNGITTTSNDGAAEKACTCSVGGAAAGASKGGKGGNGGIAVPVTLPTGGNAGTPTITPSSPATATGAGQTADECRDGTSAAKRGSDAPIASNGAGASSLGSIDGTGWHPAAGKAGDNGAPGQGGGGGGGGTPNGGGGGGACGGCGGGAGGAGAGGGASIAVLSLNSSIELTDCELIAKTAGAGGSGQAGVDGQEGGVKGNSSASGCQGGGGGKGGAGGAGGGGAGGIAVTVAYKGTSPVLDDATKTKASVPASGGAAGVGGKAGVNDGVPGLAQKDPYAVP